jgi:hypothetical protein
MFRKTVVAHALTIAFSATALTVAVMQPAMAQSNATGNIYGRVDAPAGATVNLLNTDTGLRRTATVSADGRYQVTALPTGHYKVELVRSGAVASTVEVDLIIGQGVEASFATAAAAPGVQTVRVEGRRSRIDVSNTNNSTTFTARELAALPLAKSVDAIIQLAPNTSRADSRYEGGASIGGGGPSENAYYINGFPVTNPLTQLGGAELPFGAIAQADIISGGFGAEFGRSVGGVVNITTKSGTNNWEAGISATVTPNGMRAKEKDYYYGNTGKNPTTDNQLLRRANQNTSDGKTYGGYVGGPLIKDKLFLFVAAENLNTDFEQVINTTASDKAQTGLAGYRATQRQVRRHIEKLDWNITDNHRIEVTQIGDNTQRDVQLMGYNYATGAINRNVASAQHFYDVGGNSIDAQILKYTGNLTENLTLTALTGKSTSPHRNTFDNYDVNKPLYQVSQVTGAAGPGFAPGLNYTSPQFLTGNIVPVGAQDEIKSNRLDLEWKLGRHTLRAGLDDNKLTSLNAGDITAGGGAWSYRRTTTPNAPILLGADRIAVGAGAPAGSLAAQGYYVREAIFNTATNTYSNQSAQYLEDRFQVTKDVLLIGGVRVEQMENINGDKETFLEVKNQIAPRFSASWDVYGDSSLKVFGSAGRYSLQIPTHISVRGASRSLNTVKFYTYTGTDANGNPTGLTALTQPYSSNNEYYQKKDPLSVTAVDIKPTYQDEATIGFEKAFSPSLNFGAKVTYRKLRQTIDDFCDATPIDAWAARNGVSEKNYDGFGCASFNPGEANSFLIDFNNAVPALAGKTHTLVSLTAADLGFDKAKRTYTAVDLFAEHPYRNGWYGKLFYTWSRSTGNTEGQTLSDVAQTDVAATQTWDFPQIMEFSDGLLPSNRTHAIKAYGFWQVRPEWTVGGNFVAQSGRPKSCLGEYPNGFDASGKPLYTTFGYGSAFHYCDHNPSPRGSAGKLPWDVRLDLNLAYKPEFIKGVMLKLDVFNVTNRQTAQTVDEQYADGTATNTVSSTYGRVISYTAPRSVRLSAEYNIKF